VDLELNTYLVIFVYFMFFILFSTCNPKLRNLYSVSFLVSMHISTPRHIKYFIAILTPASEAFFVFIKRIHTLIYYYNSIYMLEGISSIFAKLFDNNGCRNGLLIWIGLPNKIKELYITFMTFKCFRSKHAFQGT
jgi:hypothetical protein